MALEEVVHSTRLTRDIFRQLPALKMMTNKSGRSPYFEDNKMDRWFPKGDLPEVQDQTFIEEQITGLCGSLVDLQAKEARKLVMYPRLSLSISHPRKMCHARIVSALSLLNE